MNAADKAAFALLVLASFALVYRIIRMQVALSREKKAMRYSIRHMATFTLDRIEWNYEGSKRNK